MSPATDQENRETTADPSRNTLPDFMSLRVGEALRLRRESLGWDLPDVAEWLKIRLPYLEALESGNVSALPGNVYAVGFLKTYAAALGFPAEQMVSRFRHEARGIDHKPRLKFPAPEPEKTVPAGVLVFLGFVVIAGAYAGWYSMAGHPSVTPERIPPVSAVMPGVRPGPLPSPQIASMMADSRAPSADGRKPAPLPQPAEPDAPSLPVGAGNETAAPPVTSEQPAPPQSAAAPGAGEPASPPAAAPSEAPPAGPVLPVIHATADSWVRVKDSTGKVVYDHIMQPGEAWTDPADGGPFVMTVGNAGGIVVALGNVTTAPLGKNGAVLRNVTLSADAVQNGALGQTAPGAPPVTAPPVSDAPVIVPEDSSRKTGSDDMGVENALPVPPPPAVHPRIRRPKPAPAPHESSADDLNARQLQSLRPAGGPP